MAKFYQVVEKEGMGIDWQLVRYNDRAMGRFDDEQKAWEAAIEYVTDLNCNNSLTKTEKRANIEAFIMMPEGCFLGILDGEPWFMEDRHGKRVVDKKYFELEGKTEVIVRPVPGS